MRTLVLITIAMIVTSPLWAQETEKQTEKETKPDPFDNIARVISCEGGSEGYTFRYEGGINTFMLIYDEYLRQADMDFAVLGYEKDCLNGWTAGISAQYLNPPSQANGRIGFKPEPAMMYGLFHYLSKSKRHEGRVYIPLAKIIEGHRLKPSIKLEQLTLVDFGPAALFLRGEYELDSPPELEAGVLLKFGDLQARAYSSGNWSVRMSVGF